MKAETAWAVSYVPLGEPGHGIVWMVYSDEKDIMESLSDCESKCGCCENRRNKLDYT